MIARILFSLFPAAAWLLAPQLPAQENMSLRFLAFPQRPDAEPVELRIGEKETIKVSTPSNELSQTYTVPALPSIAVGKMGKNAEGKDVFETYGSAKSLGCAKQIVLLIRKGESHSDGFVVIPVDGGTLDFKPASYLFVNASGHSVAAIIGDKRVALEPGGKQLVKPAPTHADGICQVTFFYRNGEDWKKVYDTRWPASEKFRSIVFFYQDPRTQKLGIVPIVDVLPYAGN